MLVFYAHTVHVVPVTVGTSMQTLPFRPFPLPTGALALSSVSPERAQSHESVANVRGLPTWYGRVRLLREERFPSPRYVRRSDRLTEGMCGAVLFPVPYLHRLVHGVGEILRGRK